MKFWVQEKLSGGDASRALSDKELARAAKEIDGARGKHYEYMSETVLGGGENSRISRVLVKVDKDRTLSVIVKRRPESEGARRVAAIQRWYEREIFFYRKLAQKLKVPRCGYARYSHMTGNFLLVLEDCAAQSSSQRTEGEWNFEEAALLAMARLHDLQVEDRGPLPFTPVHLTLAPAIESYFRSAWKKAVKTTYDLEPHVVSLLDHLAQEGVYAKLCGKLAEGPLVLVHGDFRPENMFFDANSGEIVVYDWQFLSLAKGAYDYAYFLGLMDTELRRTRESDFRQLYTQHRRNNFKDRENNNFFGDDLQVSVLLALASFVMGAATANDHDTHHRSIHRLATAAIDWHADKKITALMGPVGGK